MTRTLDGWTLVTWAWAATGAGANGNMSNRGRFCLPTPFLIGGSLTLTTGFFGSGFFAVWMDPIAATVECMTCLPAAAGAGGANSPFSYAVASSLLRFLPPLRFANAKIMIRNDVYTYQITTTKLTHRRHLAKHPLGLLLLLLATTLTTIAA